MIEGSPPPLFLFVSLSLSLTHTHAHTHALSVATRANLAQCEDRLRNGMREPHRRTDTGAPRS